MLLISILLSFLFIESSAIYVSSETRRLRRNQRSRNRQLEAKRERRMMESKTKRPERSAEGSVVESAKEEMLILVKQWWFWLIVGVYMMLAVSCVLCVKLLCCQTGRRRKY